MALLPDLRYAFRGLAKAPAFTAVAVISLGLGIGANSAIFSLLDQLLLRPLPVRNPEELVQLAARGRHYGSNWGMNAMSYPMYRDFRDKGHGFAGVLCRRDFFVSLGYEGQAETARAEVVSGNYFELLGVDAALGRTLLPEDDVTPGGHPVAVLEYGYWQRRFGGDPGVVGRKILFNREPFTVVGVAQEGFTGVEIGTATQIFVPVAMQERVFPSQKLLEDRRTRFVNVFARLKPGFTAEKAQAAAQPLYRQILQQEIREKEFAKADRETIDAFLRSYMTVFPGGTGTSFLRREFGPALWMLLALTGVVLLIACANVANLQLARATARQKEIAVRLAVGASRGQIVRQMLVESLLLGTAGAALALALAAAANRALLALLAPETSRLTITAGVDPRMLGFTLAVSLAAAVLSGLAPALQGARHDLASTLKDQAAAAAAGTHGRFRKALVTAQVTLSLLLLTGAGLFAKSLYNLRTLDPGFRTERLLFFAVDPNANAYSVEQGRDFYRRLYEELAALPGVVSVSSANVALVSGDEWDSSITIEGHDPSQGSKAWAYQNHVTPGYFQTIGVPLKAGRDFRWNDNISGQQVTIVNEQFVREYFPDRDPIGRHVGMGSDPGTKTDIEIIGVVKDFKYEHMSEKIGRQMYRPVLQMPFLLRQCFYLRTAGPPEATFAAARQAVGKLDPNLPVAGMRTMERQVERNLARQTMVAGLSVCFGALATVLAVVGLYGVMTYLVGRRSREIGIRMALGADQGKVVGMILREVLVLVAVGLAAGLAGALGLTRLVEAQLYGVTPSDPGVLAGAAAALAAVALAAGWLPARRASRTDPLRVLRYD
jgi:predicted permease